MSPTEHAFDFATTINSRFDAATTLLSGAAASSSSTPATSATSASQPYQPLCQQHEFPLPFSLDDNEYSPRTDRKYSLLGTSSPATSGFNSIVSPRPVTFHWEDYQGLVEDPNDSSDQDDFHHKDHHHYRHYGRRTKSLLDDSDDDDQETGNQKADDYDEEYEDRMKRDYQRQFEGHHSLVCRRSSFGGRGGDSGHGVDSYSEDSKYDSMRHGIGQNVSDVSDELAKARLAMTRASQAMRSMEQELKAMQLSIGKEVDVLFLLSRLFFKPAYLTIIFYLIETTMYR
jgi:hypothetical protein